MFLFVLPPVLSSPVFINKINSLISSKTNIDIKSEHFLFTSYPNLSFDLKMNKLMISKDNVEILTAKNADIRFDIRKMSLEKIDVDYVFVNEAGLKKFFSKKSNRTSFQYKFMKLPEVSIRLVEIWFDKNSVNSIFVTLSNLYIVNNNNKTFCSFEAEIISDLFRNLINIGKKGYLYLEDKTLYANNLQILVGVSKLNINGKIFDSDKNTEFTLNGSSIPISDIKASLLYFQKIKDSSKKFIENFYNFSGEMDVDLVVKQNGIFGKCIAKKLAANTVLFNVPIFFNNVEFIFDKKDVEAAAYGILGGEKVYTSFKLSDMASSNQEVVGYVFANLTDKVASKYVPDLSIQGIASTSVNYKVKNKKINVNYLLKLKEGSDIFYKNAYLGLSDKSRRLFVKTLKDNDKFYITHYDYSFQTGSDISNIMLGDGLLIKENGHFNPSYISCKTNGYAPVSVTGSFGRYIDGGYFSGDLKYDFGKKLLTGIFTVIESKYKGFFLEKADVVADFTHMNIIANGTYRESPFNVNLTAQNDFSNKIHIYDMELFLQEFIMSNNKTHKKDINKTSFKIPEPPKNIDIDIDNWKIKLNKFKRKRIELTNILLAGSLKNDLFSFSMSDVNFAGGLLFANGIYNVKEHSSDIIFSAKNIDSNTVADVIFDLPNQIEGTANATLHAQTRDFLKDVKAYATFSLKEGYLPQIASTEFIIKKSKKVKRPLKFKLSDIVNIDIKNMKALSSNLNGSFCFDNNSIYNAKITSSQKYLSMFIEGDYNFDTQYADLNLFGKYNNSAISRVKILFVPLSWIMKFLFKQENTMHLYENKLKEVPPIMAKPDEQSAFRVKMDGNLNKNDVKVELKSII